jgi:integrase
MTPGETYVLPLGGVGVRQLYGDWHRIVGNDRRPKDARSSTGTQLIEAGVPTAVVQAMLGHSSIGVTERHYISKVNALRAAAAARFLQAKKAE